MDPCAAHLAVGALAACAPSAPVTQPMVRIPIIYRRNHPSPLLQSGSGAVFVAERAVSVTPYRKTISPQTTQLLFLSLSLSKIGIIDGFLSDKSIREIGKFIKYNIISDFHSDFHRGGDFVMGEF